MPDSKGLPPRSAPRGLAQTLGASTATLLLVAVGCSPGVGRDPVFPDAMVRLEAGVIDVGPADAGVKDSGPQDVPVFLPDSGPAPSFPFTGVFGILGDPSPLFAREVQGMLHVVIGDFPYTYIGTIDEAGQVDLRSAELAGSNCTQARITGTYARADALHDLLHQTCNAQGGPVSAEIRGGFNGDYDARVSGEYEVEVTVTGDVSNCFGLGTIPDKGAWGVSLLPDRTIAVFTARDPVGPAVAYFGRAETDLSGFSALHHLDASGTGTQFAMTARFEQPSALDPMQIVGTRDLILPDLGCTLSASFVGTRVTAP